jgi:hypothetical protein
MFKARFILFFCICACSTRPVDEGQSKNASELAKPKRFEYSTDTTLNSWDSLLLYYTYHPINRKLTSFDREWYVFHDSAERFCGYKNMKGDTVIPMKYGYIPWVTDTFRDFAYVWLPTRGLVAINKNEEVLFEPYYFDTHPDDNIVDGLFRIKKGEKVGFANLDGKIAIEPVYDEASSFENGYARVGLNCYTEMLYDEHNPTICRQSGIINKKGKLLFISSNKDSIQKVYQKLTNRD